MTLPSYLRMSVFSILIIISPRHLPFPFVYLPSLLLYVPIPSPPYLNTTFYRSLQFQNPTPPLNPPPPPPTSVILLSLPAVSIFFHISFFLSLYPSPSPSIFSFSIHSCFFPLFLLVWALAIFRQIKRQILSDRDKTNS